MKLSELKTILETAKTIGFQLPDGQMVPNHFHVTEIGRIKKDFIDCGGTLRKEEVISLQLWNADDYDHRLNPGKLINIVRLSERKLGLPDLEIEVEYQGETINKFGLDYNGKHFLLVTKKTDCLAKDNCGIPVETTKRHITPLMKAAADPCIPGNGCC